MGLKAGETKPVLGKKQTQISPLKPDNKEKMKNLINLNNIPWSKKKELVYNYEAWKLSNRAKNMPFQDFLLEQKYGGEKPNILQKVVKLFDTSLFGTTAKEDMQVKHLVQQPETYTSILRDVKKDPEFADLDSKANEDLSIWNKVMSD